MGVPYCGGPYNKDPTLQGTKLGSPIFGNSHTVNPKLSQGVLKQMGSCQNRGPFLGTLNNRCRKILGTPKGTIMLTTTQMVVISPSSPCWSLPN